MLNLRPAPESTVLEIKRRLEKHNPGVVLAENTVKLCSLPGFPFVITTFILVLGGDPPRRAFTAELCKPDLPHVYLSEILPANVTPKQTATAMLKVIAGLTKTLVTDPRFQRKIIPVTLNGHLHSAK